jgi:uncharacterized protein (TIGR02284 family)
MDDRERFQRQMLIETIAKLVAACHDGARGYREAEIEARDADLKWTCGQLATEREAFGEQLEGALQQYGKHVAAFGTVAGDVHHAWMRARAALENHRPSSILAECERGEFHALKLYEAAMKEELPTWLDVIVGEQYMAISDTHQKLQRMRERPSILPG